MTAELAAAEPHEAQVVTCFATRGSGHRDEQRIRELLTAVRPAVWPFDRTRKAASLVRLLRRARREQPSLIVMEGTGVSGGVAVLLAWLIWRVPYVVSSGDAIAPFVRARAPRLAWLAAAYERTLCRWCAGFIGWTPYLAGRALTFGAPRAMTAPNWAPAATEEPSREEARDRLSIPQDALVFGLIGSLEWNPRLNYCYGVELVKAEAIATRRDLYVLIVGDGDGRERLAELAGERFGRSVFLPGAVKRDEVPDQLAAMDVASLPQSTDAVGAFRYTTKISEYLASGLPVVTGRLPFAYDLDGGWLWRLPGAAPWDEPYIRALGYLMASLDATELAAKRAAVPRASPIFDRNRQIRAVSAFIEEILSDHSRRRV